jgi:hypothetical protein
VIGVEGMGSGDDGCLVAVDRRNGSDLTLTLQVPQPARLCSGHDHVDEDLSQLGV